MCSAKIWYPCSFWGEEFKKYHKKMKETNGLRINVKSIQIWTTNSITGPPVIKTSISEEVVFRKRNYS